MAPGLWHGPTAPTQQELELELTSSRHVYNVFDNIHVSYHRVTYRPARTHSGLAFQLRKGLQHSIDIQVCLLV
jgi:hypothetical protein